MQAKFYRIAKDEWEAGSYQTRVKCGARIRNIVEIDGHAHGADCAASTLGWKGTKAQLNKKVEYIVKTLAYAKSAVESNNQNAIINAVEMLDGMLRQQKIYDNDLYHLRCRDGLAFLKATLQRVGNGV